MHLTPREQERLLLHNGAALARQRIARGAALGAPDAVALVCDEICEMAWDDVPYDEVVRRAREIVPPGRLLPGVPSLVPSLQVEALFPHGSVLVHVDAPFGAPDADGPGAVRAGAGRVELAPGRERGTATLHNTGRTAVWVSSHVPLDRINAAVTVRVHAPAAGARYRLDVPAGSAIEIGAGTEHVVDVVRLGGGAR